MNLSNVRVERGRKPLFNGLSFTLDSGGLIWVQGTNGIGKTSLLRLAAGLSMPDSGTISWRAEGNPCKAEHITAYQAHGNALKRQFTALEELTFWARLYSYHGSPINMLEHVGLHQRAHVKTGMLSAGQKRRLAIARLLVSQRPLWVMDEPVAAMDAAGQSLIIDIINEHIDRGGAALVASHDSIRSFSGPTSVLTLAAP